MKVSKFQKICGLDSPSKKAIFNDKKKMSGKLIPEKIYRTRQDIFENCVKNISDNKHSDCKKLKKHFLHFLEGDAHKHNATKEFIEKMKQKLKNKSPSQPEVHKKKAHKKKDTPNTKTLSSPQIPPPSQIVTPHHLGYGIENPKNCCYLNSVVQALRFAGIENDFRPVYEGNDSQTGKVRAKLQEITSTLKNRAVTGKEIHRFRNYLRTSGVLHKNWTEYGQEDAHELCLSLFTALKTKITEFSYPLEDGRRINDTTTIAIYPAIGTCMEEVIWNGGFQFKENSLPDVFSLQIKRFTFTDDGKVQKLQSHIAPTRTIFLPLIGDGIAEYELVSAIVHAGETPQSGHYYTYVTEKNNNWIRYDDSSVSIAKEGEKDLAQNGYLYFYRRVKIEQ